MPTRPLKELPSAGSISSALAWSSTQRKLPAPLGRATGTMILTYGPSPLLTRCRPPGTEKVMARLASILTVPGGRLETGVRAFCSPYPTLQGNITTAGETHRYASAIHRTRLVLRHCSWSRNSTATAITFATNKTNAIVHADPDCSKGMLAWTSENTDAIRTVTTTASENISASVSDRVTMATIMVGRQMKHASPTVRRRLAATTSLG